MSTLYPEIEKQVLRLFISGAAFIYVCIFAYNISISNSFAITLFSIGALASALMIYFVKKMK